jgi:tetratricopeptide (TPR) repeat protein
MRFLTVLLIFLGFHFYGISQPNCNVYKKEDPCFKACEVFAVAISHGQGSFQQDKLLDSALTLCPTFSHAWREKSVPYLKNGEFGKWKQLIDKAVENNPEEYLNIRAWCRYQFLRDYQGTLNDIEKMRTSNILLGFSTDGDYDMRVVEALCFRELGDAPKALSLFEQYLKIKESKTESFGVGYYDYLHSGVTKLKAGFIREAIADFEKQFAIYKELPDTHYYCGLAYLELNDPTQASIYFKEADTLFKKGYKRNDTYIESLDKVYHDDVKKHLQ